MVNRNRFNRARVADVCAFLPSNDGYEHKTSKVSHSDRIVLPHAPYMHCAQRPAYELHTDQFLQ